jgi:hypothetical protein
MPKKKYDTFLTDEQVEAEIDRLNASEAVAKQSDFSYY